MAWDGTERREGKSVGFCQSHIDLVSDMAVIKESLKNIEKTITEGVSFRTGITISFVSVALIIVLQIIAFSYLYGQLGKQVEVNTAVIKELSQKSHTHIEMGGKS